ncbi:MAG: hypothetical protein ABI353_14185 [Isosphaeraceae bacterium]
MTLATVGLIGLGLGANPSRGDEPRGLGRLFRFGSLTKPANDRPSPPPSPRPQAAQQPQLAAPTTTLPGPSTPNFATTAPDAGTAPRLVPQPRVSRAATESDPILTRVALGRTDDGKQFGMFLQIYADGTVIDSEGVHRVNADALRPLVHAIQSADVSRLKGHCGGPPTDFIEAAYIVVYDRALGRLRANTFSYSGNAQGCDASIQQLHAAVDAIQTKLTPVSASPAVSTNTPFSVSTPGPPISLSAPPPIPLTAP